MHEFFRGWRRKAGLLLLVVALVLTAAWTRSYRVFEGYTFGMDERHATHVIDVSWGQIIWSRRELLRVFNMGEPHYQRGLSLLSAYLLLWKPRKRMEPDHAWAFQRLAMEGGSSHR